MPRGKRDSRLNGATNGGRRGRHVERRLAIVAKQRDAERGGRRLAGTLAKKQHE
jgi:hypothetical protein